MPPTEALIFDGGAHALQVPCLISKVDETVKRLPDKPRQTQYTVEAISLDSAKTWIGINQIGVARWVSECGGQMYIVLRGIMGNQSSVTAL